MPPLNPLARSVSTTPTCNLSRSFCAWSDLLGFGRAFSEANWEPNAHVWEQQAKRIGAAYRTHCRFVAGGIGTSYMLLLNDGVVRTITWTMSAQLFDLALWLRDAVQGHYTVCQQELNQSMPGSRTVISSGWVAEHSFAEFRLDDLVFDYTRPPSGGVSELARRTGNPLIASSPKQLQLNTAFSRSYLLDEAGSKVGLSGAHVYLDEQFITDVTALVAEDTRFRTVSIERENDVIFAVEHIDPSPAKQVPEALKIPTKEAWCSRMEEEEQKRVELGYAAPLKDSGQRPWLFGFLLAKPAQSVKLPNLQTTVHLVDGYFPHDEDPSDFMLQLWGAK